MPVGIETVKRGALTLHALDVDGSGVELRDLVHQREPDAAAFEAATARALHTVEALEDTRQLMRWDAGAGVAHLERPRGRRASASVTRSRPRNVNLKALEIRFSTIFSQRARSTYTGAASGGQSTRSRRPASSTIDWNAPASPAVSGPRSVGANASSTPPAAMRAKVEQVVDQLQQADGVAVHGGQLVAGKSAAGRATAFSTGPRISVSGVRNSWLTLLKNDVLARPDPELLVGLAQLTVGRRQLTAAADDFALHLAGPIAQLLADLARLHELGHVLDAVQDVAHVARGTEDGQVLGAPVLALKAAIGAADVVLLHRHRVRRARGEHALERGAQVVGARRLRVVGVIGEHLEEAATERLLARGVRRQQARVGGRDHREARRIRQEDQQNVGG